ncbi:MAG: hypothetical protein ACR2HE_03605 [Casimicrobiaceae bacterium]
MAKANSTVVRDHSYQDLNPLLEWDSDGAIDLEESVDNIARLSAFLEDLYTIGDIGGNERFSSGMFLVQGMMTAALDHMSAQIERKRESKRDPELSERLHRLRGDS